MDVYDFTIPEGTIFHLPEIHTSLPEGSRPRCGEREEHANAFARPHLIAYFGDEDRADRYLAQGHPHYACAGFPCTLKDRARCSPATVHHPRPTRSFPVHEARTSGRWRRSIWAWTSSEVRGMS